MRKDELALKAMLSWLVKLLLLLLLLIPLLPTATEIASRAARCLSKLSFEIGLSTDRKFAGESDRIDKRRFGELLGDEVSMLYLECSNLRLQTEIFLCLNQEREMQTRLLISPLTVTTSK